MEEEHDLATGPEEEMMVIQKKKEVHGKLEKPPSGRSLRHSSRIDLNTGQVVGVFGDMDDESEESDRNKKLFIEKTSDGKERARKAQALKTLTNYSLGEVYTGSANDKERNRVNGRKRISQHGGEPCYDIMEDIGPGAIYVYALPLSVMAGLLQGLKSESSIEQFRKKAKTLSTQPTTNYMFLHWKGEGRVK